MQDQLPGETACDSESSFETRVAIDVMFEALSHIQASIDASDKGEEERVKSYRRFKEALYERYEHLLDERRRERADETVPAQNGHAQNGQAREQRATDRGAQGGSLEEADDSSEGEGDTLGKLWPAISEKEV